MFEKRDLLNMALAVLYNLKLNNGLSNSGSCGCASQLAEQSSYGRMHILVLNMIIKMLQ